MLCVASQRSDPIAVFPRPLDLATNHLATAMAQERAIDAEPEGQQQPEGWQMVQEPAAQQPDPPAQQPVQQPAQQQPVEVVAQQQPAPLAQQPVQQPAQQQPVEVVAQQQPAPSAQQPVQQPAQQHPVEVVAQQQPAPFAQQPAQQQPAQQQPVQQPAQQQPVQQPAQLQPVQQVAQQAAPTAQLPVVARGSVSRAMQPVQGAELSAERWEACELEVKRRLEEAADVPMQAPEPTGPFPFAAMPGIA
mgnify:CR=1 FL=1